MDLAEKIGLLTSTVHLDQVCGLSSFSQRLTNLTPQKGPIYLATQGNQKVALLKILLSNRCEFNCSYCAHKRDYDFPRASLEPQELINLTLELYQKRSIQGLFLSSAVDKSPDATMERMLYVVRKLRLYYRFPGYIHLKIIPGSDVQLIKEAVRYASRVSLNLEFATQKSLNQLAPNKKPDLLFKPLKIVSDLLASKGASKQGQTTQFIVGASKDSDATFLQVASNLYKKYKLKRVYYSAFVPVRRPLCFDKPNAELLLREHRLYQADYLIRLYGFNWQELFFDKNNLDLDLDPKTSWALANLDFFPVEVNKASLKELLRVPGLGLASAKRIVKLRKKAKLTLNELEKLGLNFKKAKYFLTAKGKYFLPSLDLSQVKRFLRKEKVSFLPLN